MILHKLVSMKTKALIIFLVIAGAQGIVHAQMVNRKHTFNLELGLPNGFSNAPFKKIMQGLVNVAPYYQYAFANNLIIGAGVQYTHFNINPLKVTTPIRGGLHTLSGIVKVGWEKFHTEQFATDFSFKFGYMKNQFIWNKKDGAGKQTYSNDGVYLEPTMGFILAADEQTSYRFFIGYGFQGFKFKANMIGLEPFSTYETPSLERVSSYLLIGFGYTYYF
jgi:hypothetical protein